MVLWLNEYNSNNYLHCVFYIIPFVSVWDGNVYIRDLVFKFTLDITKIICVDTLLQMVFYLSVATLLLQERL